MSLPVSMKERLAHYDDFLDVGILAHGFAPHMRDYDVLFEALWGRDAWADRKGTYRLRFTHCPEASTITAVRDERWKTSWADEFTDFERWRSAGEPDGFVWGACWSTSYPGLTYLDDSERARAWSQRLGQPMHEVSLETEAYRIQVVFHDFTVTKLSEEVRVLDRAIFPLGRWEEGGGGAPA